MYKICTLIIVELLIFSSIVRCQNIFPNKHETKTQFKRICKAWREENEYSGTVNGKKLKLICNNDNNAFKNKDTIQFFSSENALRISNQSCETLEMCFQKHSIVIYINSNLCIEPPQGKVNCSYYKYSKIFKLRRYVSPKYKFHYKNKKSYLYIKGNDKINELFLVYRIKKDESEKNNEFYSITLIRIH